MKKFIFTRIVTVEERYSVTMSDEMGNGAAAKNILLRALGKEELTPAIELTSSRVVKNGRVAECK